MKRLYAALLTAAMGATSLMAQSIPARPLTVAFDDEKQLIREAYRESPYYMDVAGTWRQKNTDSSVLYTKQIDVERTWKDYRVYLSARCGHACRLYVGGKEVGFADDSRQWNEFFISPYLKYGKPNTIVIEAMKRPVGALLEDSNIAVGLNGTPFLLFRNDPELADLGIVSDYDAALGAGTLTVDATLFNSSRKGRYYIEVEVLDPKGHQLDRMGRWVVFAKTSEEKTDISRTWPGVLPWSADNPALYTAIVRLRNDNMDVEETVGFNFGFRRVEVVDGVLTVNGKPVTLRGVTYGIEHTEGETGRQQIARDLQAMKLAGINAVRTTVFSPMEPYFYAQCDKLGLYVVADANLTPASSGHRVVATEQDMIPLFERRVENIYGSLRNHPSIIVWSLGNSKDNGVCMTAAYKRLKAIDKGRPVMFAGAMSGENTDIIAPDFPSTTELQQMASTGDRPVVMARSTDAPRFANMGPLWRLVENNYKIQGGFLDAWPLSSDMLYDLRNLYAPFTITKIRVGGGEGEFRVTNNSDFADFSKFRLEYTIYTNLRANIISGELPLAVKAGESGKVGMRIPQLDLRQGEEPYIKFDISRRVDGSHRMVPVSHTVFPLPMKKAAPAPYDNQGGSLTVQEDSLGVLHIRFGNCIADFDKTLTVYDIMHTKRLATPLPLFDNARDCKRQVLASTYRQVDSATLCIEAMVRYAYADGRTLCDVRETYAVRASGDITVDYTFVAPPSSRAPLSPSLLALPWNDNEAMQWYGHSADMLIVDGMWRDVSINTMSTADLGYAEERHETRWAVLYDTTDGTLAMMARLDNPVFTLRQSAAGLVLVPDVAPAAARQTLRLVLKVVDHVTDSVAGLCRMSTIVYPPVSTGVPEPPEIKAGAARFAQPLEVSIVSPSAGVVRYTVDGSDPTDESPLYTKPITITSTTVVKARVFAHGVPPSFVASRKFNYDYIGRTAFSRRPNTPYNVGSDTLLFDGERGDVDNLSHGWVGFSGDGVTTDVTLSKPIDVESVTLRFAHNPAVWAFAPMTVTVAFSTDGADYSDTVMVQTGFDPSSRKENTARVVEINVPAGRRGVVALKVMPQTIGTIPAWHRAKGLNPWLLMDEMSVIEKAE